MYANISIDVDLNTDTDAGCVLRSLAIGIDIGGSKIKAALVDTSTGKILGRVHALVTPADATPDQVAKACQNLVETVVSSPEIANVGDALNLPVGVAFPGPLPGGEITFMAHLSQQWVGVSPNQFFSTQLGRKTWVLNDADAAGLAEATYGAARHIAGSVFVATLGTGIGTALIHNGVLFPNTELGHIEIDGMEAETQAAASQRIQQNLSWEQWIERLQRYLNEIEKLFWPQIIVLGGGISAHHEKFVPQLQTRAQIVPAKLQNTAGIIGAAHWARVQTNQTPNQ